MLASICRSTWSRSSSSRSWSRFRRCHIFTSPGGLNTCLYEPHDQPAPAHHGYRERSILLLLSVSKENTEGRISESVPRRKTDSDVPRAGRGRLRLLAVDRAATREPRPGGVLRARTGLCAERPR